MQETLDYDHSAIIRLCIVFQHDSPTHYYSGLDIESMDRETCAVLPLADESASFINLKYCTGPCLTVGMATARGA